MDKTMPNDNISVSNAEIPPTSNGIVLSTLVEPVAKLHLDMLHEPVKDVSMMMEYMAITTLKENMMETSLESVDFLCHKFPFYFLLQTTANRSLCFFPLPRFLNPSFTPLLTSFIHPLFLSNTTLGFYQLPTNGVLYGVHQSYFD
jgi:hypothetical protein